VAFGIAALTLPLRASIRPFPIDCRLSLPLTSIFCGSGDLKPRHLRGLCKKGAVDADPEGVVRVRANNPSPLTLDGTNTYVVGGRWVVDPGPSDAEHLDAVRAAAGEGIEGVVLTHRHLDHSEGAEALGAPVVLPEDGYEVGPFVAIATPGHSPDSVCLLADRKCFTGDTVLGEGSVFIAPDEGSLSAYLDSLRRLRELDLEVLCPGHGPYVWAPRAKLDEYIEHRLDRERRLLDALDSGIRTHDELLDAAWSDAPASLRPAAELTLRAHLDKLAEEGRLPADLKR
jgi:glyoxylase-like metal-dependent hydrolase (beta-lactamase superfamily II)